MNIPQILDVIRPGAKWVLTGGTYDGLDWQDVTQPKPTLDEIVDGQKQFEATSYQESRRKEYPPIGDQLDALWTGGDAAAEMKKRIESVKAKFPKPK